MSSLVSRLDSLPQGLSPDEIVSKLNPASHGWRSIVEMTDADFAALDGRKCVAASYGPRRDGLGFWVVQDHRSNWTFGAEQWQRNLTGPASDHMYNIYRRFWFCPLDEYQPGLIPERFRT